MWTRQVAEAGLEDMWWASKWSSSYLCMYGWLHLAGLDEQQQGGPVQRFGQASRLRPTLGEAPRSCRLGYAFAMLWPNHRQGARACHAGCRGFVQQEHGVP